MHSETTVFSDLQLSDVLLRALDDLNFEKPSPIQRETIPTLLSGKDVIGLAQTGTGKTAAFGLPILEQISIENRQPQALILAPTRELAIQVGEHLQTLSKHQRRVSIAVLCGGQDYKPQLKKLKEGAHIVVGTPGRILDHIERSSLKLTELNTFVLDEADEMLRMGFIEDVESVLSSLPEQRQIALFSATMPPRIRQIAKRYLNDPATIEIQAETATVKSIEQRFLFASQLQKPDALLRVLAVEDHQGVIVFVRTKTSTEDVASLLQRNGYRAMAIHGDMSQPLRERVIGQFRQGSIDVLVATDVAARGLDVERVTHVINYDMVHDCETYVHRIGRTGRAGRCGTTILFVTPRESRMLNLIERHTRQRITKIVPPADHLIQAAKERRFMDKLSERLEHANLPAYQELVQRYLEQHPGISAENLAAALALLLHQDKPWVEKLPAMKKTTGDAKKDFAKQPRTGASNGSRIGQRTKRHHSGESTRVVNHTQTLYRLDVGRMHGVKPGNIVGAIANEAGLQSRYITGLKIHDDHSTVFLPGDMPKSVVHDLTKAWVCGRQLKLTSLNVG